MSIRLVLPATFSLVLLASTACGPEEPAQETAESAPPSSDGEVKRPLTMQDAVGVGFSKQSETLYSRIAAEDGWQGTYENVTVEIYVFPEIVPGGYVPTSFFTDAVKKEDRWRAHRIVRNVGILCGTEGACAKLEKELRVAGGGSAQPVERVARSGGEKESAEVEEATDTPEQEIARSEPQAQEPSGSQQPNQEETLPEQSSPTVEPAVEPVDEPSSQPAGSESRPETVPAPTRPEGDALPYSVAIASFSSLADATAKLEELADQDMTLYVAPVVVKGRTYYRLLAGALRDRDAARALQERLVERRIKREASSWDIRPSELAFHMGTYAGEAEARSAVQRLLGQGVPAYVVRGSNGVYVYAGGYGDEGDAATLAERIREAGVEAELVRRVGVAR